MSNVPEHCQFCDNEPVAGFNDVVFCDEHAHEGITEAARVLAVASNITDPQRIAAMAEAMIKAYDEHNEEMNTVGDTIEVNTGYDPGRN